MKRHHNLFLFFALILLFFSGCASKNQWVRNDGSTYGLDSDHSECKIYASNDAHESFPERQKQYEYNCIGFADMTRGYGVASANCSPRQTTASSMDSTLDNLGKIIIFSKRYNECMKSRGWQEATFSKHTAEKQNLQQNSYSRTTEEKYVYVPQHSSDSCNEVEEWKTAQELDTVEGYKQYIKTCDPAVYMSTAEKRIKGLQDDFIYPLDKTCSVKEAISSASLFHNSLLTFTDIKKNIIRRSYDMDQTGFLLSVSQQASNQAGLTKAEPELLNNTSFETLKSKLKTQSGDIHHLQSFSSEPFGIMYSIAYVNKKGSTKSVGISVFNETCLWSVIVHGWEGNISAFGEWKIAEKLISVRDLLGQ